MADMFATSFRFSVYVFADVDIAIGETENAIVVKFTVQPSSVVRITGGIPHLTLTASPRLR
jgi:hypothetical protein